MNTKNNSQDNWKEQVAELFPYLGIYQIRAVIDFISSLLSSREKEIVDLCNCHEGYKSRGLIDPNCQIHDVLEIIKK